MGPEIPLRIAGSADLAAVTKLIADFRDFLESDGPANAEIEAVVALLLKSRDTEFLLAGEPETGLAQVRYRLSVWNGAGAEDAWLEDLFVEDSARGQGIGKALLEGVAARARSRGCARVQLDANQNNLAAVKLYEAAGYRPRHNEAKWGDAPDYFYTLDLTDQ